jgi:hypothetical protein
MTRREKLLVGGMVFGSILGSLLWKALGWA